MQPTTSNVQPVVRSLYGLTKVVCDCHNPACDYAHPNNSGSIVKHPKWCLIGWRAECTDAKCPFNHFQTKCAFIDYRKRDINWARKNIELIEQTTGYAYAPQNPPQLTLADYIVHAEH